MQLCLTTALGGLRMGNQFLDMRTIKFMEEVAGKILAIDELEFCLMTYFGDQYDNLLGHGQSAFLKAMVLPSLKFCNM